MPPKYLVCFFYCKQQQTPSKLLSDLSDLEKPWNKTRSNNRHHIILQIQKSINSTNHNHPALLIKDHGRTSTRPGHFVICCFQGSKNSLWHSIGALFGVDSFAQRLSQRGPVRSMLYFHQHLVLFGWIIRKLKNFPFPGNIGIYNVYLKGSISSASLHTSSHTKTHSFNNHACTTIGSLQSIWHRGIRYGSLRWQIFKAPKLGRHTHRSIHKGSQQKL